MPETEAPTLDPFQPINVVSKRQKMALMEPEPFGSQVGGFEQGPGGLKKGKMDLQAGQERILVGDATEPLTGIGIFVGLDGSDYEFRVGDPANDYLHWNGSALTIVGSITATTGQIGGWDITAGYLYNLQSGTPTASPSDGVVLASGNEALIVYENTEKRVEVGYLSAGVYGLRVYDDDGSTVIFEASDTQKVLSGAAIGTGSEISIQGWQHDMSFSATDADTVAWGAGTITLMNGTTYSIGAGNTGNMVAITYVYLDIAVSTTALQTTTTPSNAVGSGRILVAVADNVAAGNNAIFQVFGGRALGGLGKLIVASDITADTITANEIAANTITATEMNVSQLSAIAADLGSITAGDIVLPSGGFIRSGQTAYDTGTGFYIGNDTGTPRFSIGNSAANKLTWDGSTLTIVGTVSGTLDAASLSGTVPTASLGTYTNDWVFDGTWTLTDLNTVSWGAGTLTLSDGTTYSIGAGNTGNMAAKTFVYLDIGVSTTAFQTTTTRATAVGTGKLLIAIAEDGSVEPTLVVVNDDTFNIDAANIVAGSVTANEITVSTLSALSANMGTLTAGVINLSGAGANIHSGQSAYDTGTGFWLEYNSGTPRFSIGDGSDTGNKMTWDGSTLRVNGTTLASEDKFGDASDGNGTMDGVATVFGMAPSGNVYTMTRDIFAGTLTINSGVTLNMAGYRLFCATSLTVTGTLERTPNNGGNGGNGSNGSGTGGGAGGTSGAEAAALSSGSVPGAVAGVAGVAGASGGNAGNPPVAGGNGSAGNNGSAVTKSLGAAGVAGVAGVGGGKGGDDTASGASGGSGGAAGSAGAQNGTAFNIPRSITSAYFLLDTQPSVDSLRSSAGNGSGGGAGGGGGGANNVSPAENGGGGGGGGGAGGSGGTGGMAVIFAKVITVNAAGKIQCLGGNGGNGGDGGDGADSAGMNSGSGGGGAGGAGGNAGNGGVLIICYSELTNNGSISVAAGSVGTGGAGGTSPLPSGGAPKQGVDGTPGNNGAAGNTGTYIPIQV